MIYNELEALIHPFFLSRWWDSLAQLDSIQTYINLAIQDIWNEDNWTFKIYNERVSIYVDEAWKRRFETINEIDMFIEAKDQYWDDIYPTTVWLKSEWASQSDSKEFNFSWKNIYFLDSTSVTELNITYTVKYKWYNRSLNWTDKIPLPDKFIPALLKAIYDYTSPINLFEWETSQVDYYGHYTNKINKLKLLDSVSESTQFIPLNNYYA